MSSEETVASGETPAPKPFATKAALLGLAGSRFFKEVDTPIGRVRLRSLVGSEAFEIDNYAFDSKGTYERGRERYARAKRIVETVVDENGNKLFSEFDMATIANWPEPLSNTLAVEILAMAKPEALGEFAKNG